MKLTVYFLDGHKVAFRVAGDEEATLKREDLLGSGFQEKEGDTHTFYPATAISKIVVSTVD